MAVYQISRIQVRRGKANQGTGIPQLASGELAWAIDSQELYIGNGSVAEGAPQVGNTRLLTLNDLSANSNLLSLLSYVYRANDQTITTGFDANSPIVRGLQDKFDDNVTAFDFGAVGDGVTDDTVALQRAITNLYKNIPPASSTDITHPYGTPDAVKNRRFFRLPAGIYRITVPLYIPSFTTLSGDGAEKTIIFYDPSDTSKPAIQTYHDSAIPPYDISGSQNAIDPRYIEISNLTIYSSSGTSTCLQLNATRDSLFENLNIRSNTSNYTVYDAGNIGVNLNNSTSTANCNNNVFKNVRFSHVTTAVFSKGDAVNNVFTDCYIEDAKQGFVLGQGANGSTSGEVYGPRQTQIIDCKFNTVRRHAVYVERGSGTVVSNCKLVDVGNNASGNTGAVYPQIYFAYPGNICYGIQSDRADDLSTNNTSTPYIPEMSGNGSYSAFGTRQIPFGTQGQATLNPVFLFRLPVPTDSSGSSIATNAPDGVVFNVDYVYKGTNTPSYTRAGRLTISADIVNKTLQLSDEFNYAGADGGNVYAQQLEFIVVYLDATGAVYTTAPQVPCSIAIYYSNSLPNDFGYLTYTYTMIV